MIVYVEWVKQVTQNVTLWSANYSGKQPGNTTAVSSLTALPEFSTLQTAKLSRTQKRRSSRWKSFFISKLQRFLNHKQIYRNSFPIKTLIVSRLWSWKSWLFGHLRAAETSREHNSDISMPLKVDMTNLLPSVFACFPQNLDGGWVPKYTPLTFGADTDKREGSRNFFSLSLTLQDRVFFHILSCSNIVQ